MKSLHEKLVERINGVEKERDTDIYNSMLIDEPDEYIDCTPEGNYENFQHLVGDYFLYCEIANSTPYRGKHLAKKHQPLVYSRAKTKCVFDDEQIFKMEKDIKGMPILKNNVGDRQRVYPNFVCGGVVDSYVIDETFLGKPYKILALTCWLKGDMLQHLASKNDLYYMMFEISVLGETCTMCGKTAERQRPCEHVQNMFTPEGAFVICEFYEFETLTMSMRKEGK